MSERVASAERWDQSEAGASDNMLTGGNGSFGQSADHQRRLALLARTVRAEVIPRLVLAHRASIVPLHAVRPDLVLPKLEDVAELAGRALAADPGATANFVTALHARGADVGTLYLDLLAPAARLLGEMWCDDLCDFTQVTVGLLRLQHVVHDLSPAFQAEPQRARGQRIVLVPAPGDQHAFGLSIVIEFFRRAGWDVASGFLSSAADLAAMVRSRSIAVIGFSVSCENRLDALSAAIRSIRRVSRNRSIGIMVGGPIFIERPELVALVGADATAMDGRQAVSQAQSLLDLLPRRP